MTKLIITVCLVISGIPRFGTVRLLHAGQQATIPATNNAAQQEKQSRFEQLRSEATRIQPGVMTEKQKEHSKLYKSYYKIGVNKGIKLVDRGNGIYCRVALGPPIPNPSHYLPITPQEFLHQLSCKSDAVVVVKVLAKESQLTESEEFLFSDYSVKVIELLKNNEKDSLDLDSVLTVTRPGGLVNINGRIIQAIDAKYMEMQKNNEYLLFLSYIPITKSYQAVDAKSSFELQTEGGFSIKKLTSYPTVLDHRKEFNNRDIFFAEVKNAISLNCTSK